jgi:ABC-type uncharacterized transport system involved in gliding motility auxiliary subunit/ABC-type transport system involved in cytochrome c biogenesis permease component
MRGITTVLKREFLGYFRSPIAYVFLVVFVLLSVGLPWFLDQFLESDDAGMQLLFRYTPWINVLFVPAVGMRLWSEEKHTGTWELLLTLPFSTAQAVVGKFLAGWLFVGVGFLLTFPFPLTVAYLGDPDWGPILAGYGIGFLMSGAVLAICSVMSSLTENQVIAFILGVLACVVLNLTGWSVFNNLLRTWPVGLADAVNGFSFTTHFETARQGLVRLGDVIFFLAVIAGALVCNIIVLEREARPEPVRKTTTIVLVGLVVILLSGLADRSSRQLDLTREKFFTLSPASRHILRELGTEVQMELYFSSSRKGLPIGLKVFAQRVDELLRQYERSAGGRIVVRVIDPVPGSRAEEEARRLGLVAQPLGPDERLYFGLAVFHGGNRRTIPLIDYRRERLLEHDLTRLLATVQTHHLPKLGILSSLEVCGVRGVPPEQRKIEDGTAEWQFVRELRLSYQIEDIHPLNETLPADLDVLLIINPAQFDSRILHAVDQYVLAGKPAVVLVDPFNYQEVNRDEQDGNVLGAEYAKASDLPTLLPHWGLHFAPHEVIGDLENPTEVPVQRDAPPITLPIWLTLKSFDDSQSLTAGFDAVLLPHVGHLTALGTPGITVTPLLRSSPQSAALDAVRLRRMNPYRIADAIRPAGQPFVLAALSEGKFKTGYPGGRPPASPGAPVSDDPNPWDLGLRESKTTSRVIVIADADFLVNEMAYVSLNRRSENTVAHPRNQNASLLTNCLGLLSGNAHLLSITAKGQAIRPFVRIHQLKRQAEESFRGEVRTLNERLAAIDAQLIELNQQAADGGNSLISEQALSAIRRAQKEQNTVRARQAQIQEELQRRLHGLYQRLTLINMAVVPGIVAFGGLIFWRWRTRRRATP